jgi:fused signal recognition particle receptor
LVDPLTLGVLVTIVIGVVAVLLVAGRRRTGRRSPEGDVLEGNALGGSKRSSLGSRLEKTRRGVAGRWAALSTKRRIDERFWVETEDLLLAADVGVAASAELVARVRERDPADCSGARSMLRSELIGFFGARPRGLDLVGHPAVILVVGVNGAGKTTTIAKLAFSLRAGGRTVLLGAADTFRAAADEQLRVWSDRLGVDVVSGQPGADAAAVAFDAYQAGRARGADTVIVDTAGRLQNKANLMAELAKVAKVLERAAGHIDEILLVIDGSSGQNAIAQARSFADAVGVTGIVITKLDGTARGGVAVAIERELQIPLKFVGLGEDMEDLAPFDVVAFVDVLVGL